MLAESIAWATGPGPGAGPDGFPEVLYIPSEFLESRPAPQAENLIRSIGECWKIRCLPVTIAHPGQAVGAVGSLVVSVVPKAEKPADTVNLGDRNELKKLAGRPIAVRLPSSCLEGAPARTG